MLDARTVASLRRLSAVPGAGGELVELFVQSGGEQLIELERAVASGDGAAAAAVAHRLKGSSANLGAVRLSAACGLVEERLATGADPAAAVAAVRSAYDEACAALQAEFGPP